MMKNVQGSSAGAGSGEFHVYKASRRREYERLKLLEEEATKETDEAEFERKRRTMEETADAKTAKNRAKRQKKKERLKGKNAGNDDGEVTRDGGQRPNADLPIKKRRLVNGKELVFKKPGEGSDNDESDGERGRSETRDDVPPPNPSGIQDLGSPVVVETGRITIVEDD